MNNINNKIKQYKLNFSHPTYLGEEDFMITSCNQTAYLAVKTWPNWQHFGLNIYGPKSSGKSHLAHIWINTIQNSLPRPVQIPILHSHNINMKNINKISSEYSYLVIEDLDASINEEAFFHLYNNFNTKGRNILFTSEIPLSKLALKLPDLRSRLNIVPNAEIMQPDDEMLTALIAKQFNDRQIIISQEILDYILKYAERSFNYITKLVAEVDEISWIYGRAVSIPIVKEAIDNLNHDQQLELFI